MAKQKERRRSTIKSGDQRFSLVMVESLDKPVTTHTSSRMSKMGTNIMASFRVTLPIVIAVIIMTALVFYFIMLRESNKSKQERRFEESAKLMVKKNCSRSTKSRSGHYQFYSLVVAYDYFISTEMDDARVWNWDTCELRTNLSYKESHILGVYNNTLVTRTRSNGKIQQRDLATLELIRNLSFNCYVTALEGRRLVCSRDYETIRIFDFESSKLLSTLNSTFLHFSRVVINEAIPDMLVSFHYQPMTRHFLIWNTTNGQLLRRIDWNYTDIIWNVKLDSRGVLYAVRQRGWAAWNITNGEMLFQFVSVYQDVHQIFVDQEAGKLISLGFTLCILNMSDGKLIRCYCLINGEDDYPEAVYKKPNSTNLFITFSDGTLLELDSTYLYSKSKLDSNYARCVRKNE